MKPKSIIAIVLHIMLLASPVHATDPDPKAEAARAGIAVGGGAAVGGATFAVTGSWGLVIAGTALSIGAAPIIVAGGIVGAAGYGIYRIFR